MAIHQNNFLQSLRIHNSMKKGKGDKPLIKNFSIDMLDFRLNPACFSDLGRGFYITVFKGSGDYNTTKTHPFELRIYKYDKNPPF